MPFTGIYTPEELSMLSKVLDDLCQSLCIERSSPDHEDASYLVMSLAEKGARTVEQFKAALDPALSRDARRRA